MNYINQASLLQQLVLSYLLSLKHACNVSKLSILFPGISACMVVNIIVLCFEVIFTVSLYCVLF